MVDLGRYCVPDTSALQEALLGEIANGNIGRYIGDLGTCWWVFLVMVAISAVLGFLYLALLKCFAKPILYLSFLVMFVALVGGGFYAFFSYNYYSLGDHTISVMKGMGILLWILAGLSLLTVLCCWSRIRLGAAIVQAASDFVSATPSIFAVPGLFFLVICIWIAFWIVSAVYVYSVGTAVQGSTPIFSNIQWNNTTRYIWIYHLFGLFWISAFIIGCAQFAIAVATCVWYFTQGA
jgi:hypothetical protein